MNATLAPAVVEVKHHRDVARDRSSFQRAFCARILGEPAFKGAVLDIGCGSGLPPALAPLSRGYARLDGVDPDAAIAAHPYLTRRWAGRLEDASVPRGEYDLAYAYNVVEHIGDPAPFLAAVHAVLKPGGVFWALTPHGRHPFAVLSRSLELAGAGLHGAICRAARRPTVNDYPAYTAE